MHISVIPGDIYLSPLPHIGGYINWTLACRTSQSIVLTPPPCLARVQAHPHGKNSKPNSKNWPSIKMQNFSLTQKFELYGIFVNK